MKKIKMLILFILTILLVGCDVSSDITEDYVLSFGGAYRGQPKLEQSISNESTGLSDKLDKTKDSTASLEGLEQVEKPVVNKSAEEIIAPKILSIYNVAIETTYLDNDIKFLDNKTHELNGYIKSHDMKESLDKKYARIANISIRIPKKETMKLIQYIKERYLIIDDYSEAVEVSETYFDLELNIRNLKMQEEHLLNMYENTTSVDDMLKINERLMEVSKEKTKLTSDYLDLQERLEYSIIEISMHEVANDYHGLNAIDKIRNNFSIISKSVGKLVESVLVFIISLSPIIVVLIVLALSTKKVKNNLSSKLDKEEQYNEIIYEETEESTGEEKED